MAEQPPPLAAPARARLTRRGVAIAGGGLAVAGITAFFLWPADLEYGEVSGDIRPERPADYLFRLRSRVAPLRRPVPPTVTPARTSR